MAKTPSQTSTPSPPPPAQPTATQDNEALTKSQTENAQLRDALTALRKERDDAVEALLRAESELETMREQLRDARQTLKRIEAKVEDAALAAAKRELDAPAVIDLPEKYRGTKRYRVGDGGAYRGGRLYQKGEVIIVIDEVPSRTWEPVVDAPAPQAPAETAETRASELSL